MFEKLLTKAKNFSKVELSGQKCCALSKEKGRNFIIYLQLQCFKEKHVTSEKEHKRKQYIRTGANFFREMSFAVLYTAKQEELFENAANL